MNEGQGSRWRRVAVTGVLAPGLLLGVAGAFGSGALPGGFASSTASAAIVGSDACTAFGASAPASPLSVADVAAKVNPAVVSVVNMQRLSQADLSEISGIEGLPGFPDIPNFPGIDQLPGSDQLPADGGEQIQGDQDGDTLVPVGTGSGFIVDDEGHVVTNAHVVVGAEKLTVTLYDGTDVPATVVGRDLLLDVAILKLDFPAGTKVPGIAAFGDSETLRPGDEVVAIGTALGEFPNTVSDGTVNGVDRSFPGEGLGTYIQHDAEIWHGNSGGPLLDLQGEVVGMNTAGIGSGMLGADTGAADMGFAVEGNIVCNAAAELLANGKITWPYMGITGEQTQDGQSVIDVESDGPSAAAGIEAGDVITAFDGQQIDKDHSLLEVLFNHQPGDTVDVTIDRDGAVHTFQVTLGERPESTA
jgi:2-alkenal reductase